ncbi:hypothetical protein COCON_G00130040 [Conger conger]|uniref:Uncharacterized protein n=1 Tax=Conger conger TaxID=82655 RepID=A0A9Q1DDN8_CONCO|nr:hypothetical protein COCON_G00130040 [Conger conger]
MDETGEGVETFLYGIASPLKRLPSHTCLQPAPPSKVLLLAFHKDCEFMRSSKKRSDGTGISKLTTLKLLLLNDFVQEGRRRSVI